MLTAKETVKEIKNFLIGPQVSPALSQIPTLQKFNAELDEFIANEAAEEAAARRQASVQMASAQKARDNDSESAALREQINAHDKKADEVRAFLDGAPGRRQALAWKLEARQRVLQATVDELHARAGASPEWQSLRITTAFTELFKIEERIGRLINLRLEEKTGPTKLGPEKVVAVLDYRSLKLAMLGREANTHLGLPGVSGWIPATKTALKKLRRTPLTPDQLEERITELFASRPTEAPSWRDVDEAPIGVRLN